MIRAQNPHLLKISVIFSSLICSSALADINVNLSNLDNNSFNSNVGTPGSVTTTNLGEQRIVTYTLTNLDLAEDGSANDSLTFAIKISANGGTVSDFSNGDGQAWGVNGVVDREIDPGEGLRFSLASSSINLGNAGSDVGVSFVGFTGISSWFANEDLPRFTGATNTNSGLDFGSSLAMGGSNVFTNLREATDNFSVRNEAPAGNGFYLGNLRLSFVASRATALAGVLDQLTNHLNGSATLTAGQIQTLTTTLRNNIDTVGTSETILNQAIEVVELYENVRGSIFSSGQFNRNQFNNVNNALRQASLDLQQGLITYGWTAENLRRYRDTLEDQAFLSANFFPGFVAPPADPNAIYQVQINANIPRQFGFTHIFKFESARRPTGAYLAPGSIATVTVPTELINKGYRIRVNAHVHELTRLNFYRRMDFISKVFPITSETTEIASPIGGGIYIEVPYGEEDGLQMIQFQNTVRSAFYSNTVARQTSLADWLNEERNHPAPWTDFESDVYHMTLPRDWVFAWGVASNDNDPVEVMEDWSNAMRTINLMMGYTEPRSKTTLYTIVDTSIRANVFSPGYPQSNSTFNPSSASQNGRANHDFLNGPRFADFARLHELGHAEYFTKFPGEVEAAVNLFYVFAHYYDLETSIDVALGRSVGNASRQGWTRDQNAIHWMASTEFRNQVNNMTLRHQNFQQRGYTEYVDIAYMYGLDSLGRFWHQDHVDFENGISRVASRNNDQPFRRIQRLSVATGINLDPLHHFWGSSASNFEAQRQFMEDNNLPLSRLIYDRLRHYQTVIPETLQEFRIHRNLYFPHLNAEDRELYDALNNNTTGWGQEEHDAAFANVERIIDFHFPNGRPKISTFPHVADFNDNFSEWAHQEDDDAWDWRLHTGPTESVAIAGSVGSPDGSQYLLLEGHDSGGGDRAAFMDNVYDMSSLSGAQLTFDYHIRGSFIDSFSVDVHDGTQWFLDVFLLEGQQQNSATAPWISATVDLSSFVGNDEVTVRLRGQKMTFSGADISIDNLVLSGEAGERQFDPGEIAWGSPIDVSSMTDVSTNGTLVEAFNLGGSNVTDVTVNNVLFTAATTFLSSDAVNDVFGGDTGDSAYNALLSTVDFGGGTNQVELSLANGLLTPGNDYEIQVWFADTRFPDRVTPVGDGNNNFVSLGGEGQYAIGTFTAEGASQTLTLDSPGFGNAHLNAYQIRDLSVTLSPFELWAETAFVGAPVGFDTTETGNSDGDGFNNIEEWVLLLNPFIADEPLLSIQSPLSGDEFVVEYSARNVENPIVRAAWTSSLLPDSWRYDGDGLTETVLEANGEVELRAASVPMDEEPRFIRIEVETTEE